MDQITIVHYIRQHLFDSIRVENIAKELFMTARTFLQNLKKNQAFAFIRFL